MPVPLQAAVYDWSDVADPTSDELAEIDAAVAAAPEAPSCQFVQAWLDSYPVKQALAVVGMPDGSGEWLVRFTAELFAHTEAVSPYKDVADRAFALATQWHQAVGREGWNKRGQLPVELLWEMVGLMPIEAVAHYVSSMAPSQEQKATTERIEEWLFPLLDLDKARQAVELVKAGTPAVRAATQVGISHKNGLARYMKAMRVEAVCQQSDGRRLMPPSVRRRILELAAEGHGPKAVQALINEERPGLNIQYPAVKMAVLRARAGK